MFTSQLLMIGTTELLLVAGIALLLFGGKKLPDMMKGLGEGVRNFKDAVNGEPDKTKENSSEEGKNKKTNENESTPSKKEKVKYEQSQRE